MATEVGLRPLARRDLEEIWDYTALAWGVGQAEIYLRGLQNALQLLASHPSLGRSCDDVRSGYRKHLTGSHVIYYRVFGEAIDVVRILHERMDVERHL